MAITPNQSSRRDFLLRSGPPFAGGLAVLGFGGSAFAGQAQSPASAEKGKVWSKEYWAQKGEVKLYMFRKRVGAPQPGKSAVPVVFLVHGSSTSSRSFDLTVPGHGDYSLMDKFADLKAAVEVVARETGQERFHFFGESSGALRAGAFAMVRPERVNRMVLGAFTYTGQGSPTLADRGKQVEFYRTHNRRPRDRDMIRSIFTRDKPGTSDPAVGEALADVELPFGDSVPTGTYLDMTAHLPVVDPLKVHAPVMIVRGEFDGIATEEDLLNFYQKLPYPDRQFVVLPGAAHSVSLGTNRQQFWHVMRTFLDMPPRLDGGKAS